MSLDQSGRGGVGKRQDSGVRGSRTYEQEAEDWLLPQHEPEAVDWDCLPQHEPDAVG
jgi:hypothetical protein